MQGYAGDVSGSISSPHGPPCSEQQTMADPTSLREGGQAPTAFA